LLADLSRESDLRVRRRLHRPRARLASPESAAVVVPYLRSNDPPAHRCHRRVADDAAGLPAHLPALLADSVPMSAC
jgi:hypothetical protein